MEGDYLVVLTKDWIVIRVMDAADRPEVGLARKLERGHPVRLSAQREPLLDLTRD
jgi:hypothetical protein